MLRLLVMVLALVAPGGALAVTGQRALVASEHRLASEAGLAVLKRGGNAIDAAVATALAVGVVNPSSCGIGGGGFMLIFDRRSGTVLALDYRETAPAAASRDMFSLEDTRDDASLYGGLAVATPGEIAGLEVALDRFGTLSFSVVAEPAIRLARDGFPIEAHLARAIASDRERIGASPALAALLFRPDGTPLREGDILRQPNLARTLEAVAAGGARAFYEGPIADQIVRAVRSSRGVLAAGDLASYRPAWRRPLRGNLGPYRLHGMPPPSSGGGVMITVLNVIARDDLVALGHNTPTYAHLLAEAMRVGFADRAAAYGDPDFVDVPLDRLLAASRGQRLRRRLSAATTFSPPYYGDSLAARDSGTSHLSVVDAQGNAVALTTSINTSFGSHVVAGDTGVLLNNTMDDFSADPGVPNVYGLVGSEANAIAPLKRPLSSMSPTILTRNGEVVAVAGASGGPFIITSTLQTLLNVLTFGQDVESAVRAPRLHDQWLPERLFVEAGIPGSTRDALRRVGYQETEVGSIGAVQLIHRLPDGTLAGAADPRKGGQAVAW